MKGKKVVMFGTNIIIRGRRADPAGVSDQDSPFESFPDVPTREPVLQNKHVP